jgi:hypothetical protein
LCPLSEKFKAQGRMQKLFEEFCRLFRKEPWQIEEIFQKGVVEYAPAKAHTKKLEKFRDFAFWMSLWIEF